MYTLLAIFLLLNMDSAVCVGKRKHLRFNKPAHEDRGNNYDTPPTLRDQCFHLTDSNGLEEEAAAAADAACCQDFPTDQERSQVK